VPEHGREQRHQRGDEHDERDGQIDERDEGEDQDGGEERHGQLRQVLTEVHLELLNALDHREHDVAGPRATEVRRPERGDVGVERAA
jgi:hypothetical protein